MSRPGPTLMLALALVGCAGPQSEAAAPAEEPNPPETAGPSAAPAGQVEFASCAEHLDAIADCFYKVVTQVQREPREGEPVARFLGEATWQVAAADVHEACAPLGLSAESNRLQLGDGSEVLVAKSADSIDEMFSGATVWHIVYRFASASCEHTAEARIDLWAGGSPE